MNAARVSATWIGGRWVDSPAAVRERLGDLVERLDAMALSLPEQQREASGVCDMNAIERAEYTKASIAITTAEIVNEVKKLLAMCPDHVPGALVSGCPDCVAAADRRGGPAVPEEIRSATRLR